MPAPTPKQRAVERRVQGLAAIALIAPLVLFVAVLGTRAEVWGTAIGWALLAWKVGPALASLSVIAATMALVFALGDLKRRGVFALIAVLAAGATAGGYAVQHQRLTAAPGDIATDLIDPPQPSRGLVEQRHRAGSVALGAPAGCAAAVAAPTQVAPATAAYALQQAGFQLIGSAPFRVEGVHQGAWFGLAHDAVIRIRPGRTDVRVIARDPYAQGDRACRLAAEIVRNLTVQPGR